MKTDQIIKSLKARQAAAKLLKEGPNSVLLAQLVQLLQGMQAITVKGDTGDKGDRGLVGPRGAVGPAGARGAPGLRGLPGPEGTPGPRGVQGLSGPIGQRGPVGAPGEDAYVDETALEERLYERLRAAIPNTETRLPVIELFRRGGGGNSKLLFFDEGVPLGQDIQAVDFQGAGITARREGTRIVVTVTATSGGGGTTVGIETPVGAVDDSNVTFTVAAEPLYVVVNGSQLFSGDGYTFDLPSLTITLDDVVGTGGFIRSAFETPGTSPQFETPSGTVDDSNVTFTVVHTPLYVVVNGAQYFDGAGYTLVGNTITLNDVVGTGGFIKSAYVS